MATKVLNKLINVYTTLSGGDSGTTSGMSTSDLIDLIYPVGSVYYTTDEVTSNNSFGGTWAAIGTTTYIDNNILQATTTTVYAYQQIV